MTASESFGGICCFPFNLGIKSVLICCLTPGGNWEVSTCCLIKWTQQMFQRQRRKSEMGLESRDSAIAALGDFGQVFCFL